MADDEGLDAVAAEVRALVSAAAGADTSRGSAAAPSAAALSESRTSTAVPEGGLGDMPSGAAGAAAELLAGGAEGASGMLLPPQPQPKRPAMWRSKLGALQRLRGRPLGDVQKLLLERRHRGRFLRVGFILFALGLLDLWVRLASFALIFKHRIEWPSVTDTQQIDFADGIRWEDIVRLTLLHSWTLLRTGIAAFLLWQTFAQLRPTSKWRFMWLLSPCFKVLLVIWVGCDWAQEFRPEDPRLPHSQGAHMSLILIFVLLIACLHNDRKAWDVFTTAAAFTAVILVFTFILYDIALYKGTQVKWRTLQWAVAVELSALYCHVGLALPAGILLIPGLLVVRTGKARPDEDSSALQTPGEPLPLASARNSVQSAQGSRGSQRVDEPRVSESTADEAAASEAPPQKAPLRPSPPGLHPLAAKRLAALAAARPEAAPRSGLSEEPGATVPAVVEEAGAAGSEETRRASGASAAGPAAAEGPEVAGREPEEPVAEAQQEAASFL